LSIELEVNNEPAAVQFDEQIFCAALDAADGLASDGARECSGTMRPDSDGMDDAAMGNAPANHERFESAADGFHFREFGHGCARGPAREIQLSLEFSGSPQGLKPLSSQGHNVGVEAPTP